MIAARLVHDGNGAPSLSTPNSPAMIPIIIPRSDHNRPVGGRRDRTGLGAERRPSRCACQHAQNHPFVALGRGAGIRDAGTTMGARDSCTPPACLLSLLDGNPSPRHAMMPQPLTSLLTALMRARARGQAGHATARPMTTPNIMTEYGPPVSGGPIPGDPRWSATVPVA